MSLAVMFPAILLLFGLQDQSLTAKGEESRILVFRPGSDRPVLIHEVRPDFRPYIHPLSAPDGKGEVTELSPSHHRHQTGLYWGFTRLNGRDYFHHPGEGYFQRQSARAWKVRDPRSGGSASITASDGTAGR